jgi:iron complex outermembrane receptor protein
VYQVGWIDGSDSLARGYSGSRGSLDAWSTDNRLRADFTTGELAHTLIVGGEYHRFRNDLWTGAGSASPRPVQRLYRAERAYRDLQR